MFRRRDRPAQGATADPHPTPSTTSDSVLRLPLPARLADGLTLAIAAMWLRIIVIGPARLHIGGVRISASSHLRVVLLLALVIVVRHRLWPLRPLHQRLGDGIRAWWRTPNSGAVLSAAALSRVAVLAVGLVAVSAFGLPRGAPRITEDRVRDIVARWDAFWYWTVVSPGYQWAPDGQQHNVVFFPAFPIAMGATAAVLRWHPMHGGLLLSLIAFAVAAAYLYRLARESLDDEHSLAAVWLLAAYPFSVYYSAPYTESLYLLATLATLYHFGRDQWGRAAVFGIVTGLTRPNGCFLSVVLGTVVLLEMWRARQSGRPMVSRRTLVQLAVAAAPGIGMLAFTVYLYARFGVPLIWMQAQGAWGRNYTDLLELTATRATTLRESGLVYFLFYQPYELMNMTAAAFALAMIVPVWWRLGLAYAVFVAINVVPPLVLGGTLSIARLTSTLFPVFLVLGAWSGPRLRMALLVLFAILQGLVAALFFTWRPMY